MSVQIPPMERSRAGAGSSWPTLTRVTSSAIVVLLVILLVEALFESWLLVLLAERATDPTGGVTLVPPAWPKTLRNAAYLAVAALSVVLIVDKRWARRFTTPADVAFGLVVVAMLVAGVGGGSSPALIAEGMFVYLRSAVIFYAIRAVAPSWPQAQPVIWLVGGIVVVNAVVAIAFALVGPAAYSAIGVVDLSWVNAFRAQAFQDHPNHLGHVLGFAVLGLLALLAVARRVERRTWLLFAGLSLALALTQSRESIMAVVIGAAVVAVLARGHLRTMALGLTMLVVLTGITWTLQPGSLEALRHRIVGVVGAVRVPSGAEAGVTCDPIVEDCTVTGLPKREIRVLYLQQGIELWRASPLIGYGVGQFGGSVASRNDPSWNLDPRFGPTGFDLHGFPANQVDGFWVHLLVELGAIGTIAYLAWYALLAGPGVRAARRVRRVAATARDVADGVDLHVTHPWAVAGLMFGAVIAAFSPALEDPLFPPLLMGVVGLSWVLATDRPADGRTDPTPSAAPPADVHS